MSIRKDRSSKGTLSSDWDSITNKPATFPAMPHPHAMTEVEGLQAWAENMQELIPVNISQLTDDVGMMKEGDDIDYTSLSNLPSLARVASTGLYSDLEGSPTIPVLPTLASVAYSGSYADLTDKIILPTYSTVATTGEYSDLKNKPAIPVLPNFATVATSGMYADLIGKPILPVLSTVATTGNYLDLLNRPSIPTVDYPVLSVNGKTGAVILLASDVGAAQVTHTHPISGVSGLQIALDSKANQSSIRRQDVYSGVTDSSGLYTVTFATPFSAAPNIQTQVVNGTHNHSVRVTSVTPTGFTVAVGVRAGLTVLGLTVLGFDVNATPGIAIDVLVTSKTL